MTGRYREALYTDVPTPIEQRRGAMREAEERADVEYLCERIPAAFERTVDGIARVRSIVQAMKRFSHASTAEVAPADINEAIETTLVVCRNEYKYVADVALNLGELPAVTCNIGELNQVFLNLIINAAQAIEEKVGDSGEQGQITITTRADGPDAVIEIADDGPGIPPALLDRIYEPFFTTKQVGKGTGQGLALARATIERHAGSLECVSTLGTGTSVHDPCAARAPDGRDRGAGMIKAMRLGSDGGSAKPRVLCVDDEPYVLDGLRDVLGRRFDVRLAGGAVEALEILRGEPDAFAVVISDMRMPGTGGADLLRAARRSRPMRRGCS